MSKKINFGIGFLAGRPNVCNIINGYYKSILEQGKKSGYDVKFTFFILFDLEYQGTPRDGFYNLKEDVYNKMNVKYITPEDIEEEKKILKSRYNISNEDVELILGHGYAKARNAIMYFALKRKIDYLLFWDDDEYPVINMKDKDGNMIWKTQENVLEHLKNIVNADITIGYRCGNMTPIPVTKLEKDLGEDSFKDYIDAISNEAISWKRIKEIMNREDGMMYANSKILNEKKVQIIERMGKDNWLLASGICINLTNLDRLPPFYNPPEARGEDTFFSTWLTKSKVLRVPVYHFHDSFLKYTDIINGNYPDKLDRTTLSDSSIEKRFLKASIGWIKYKPLLTYIVEKENYKQIIEETHKKLEKSIPKMNKLFNTNDFSCLIEELEKYDNNVQKHYNEYLQSFESWDKIKNVIKGGIG